MQLRRVRRCRCRVRQSATRIRRTARWSRPRTPWAGPTRGRVIGDLDARGDRVAQVSGRGDRAGDGDVGCSRRDRARRARRREPVDNGTSAVLLTGRHRLEVLGRDHQLVVRLLELTEVLDPRRPDDQARSGDNTEPHASTCRPVMVRTCSVMPTVQRGHRRIAGRHPATACEEVHALPPVRPNCSERPVSLGERGWQEGRASPDPGVVPAVREGDRQDAERPCVAEVADDHVADVGRRPARGSPSSSCPTGPGTPSVSPARPCRRGSGAPRWSRCGCSLPVGDVQNCTNVR